MGTAVAYEGKKAGKPMDNPWKRGRTQSKLTLNKEDVKKSRYIKWSNAAWA